MGFAVRAPLNRLTIAEMKLCLAGIANGPSAAWTIAEASPGLGRGLNLQ